MKETVKRLQIENSELIENQSANTRKSILIKEEEEQSNITKLTEWSEKLIEKHENYKDDVELKIN